MFAHLNLLEGYRQLLGNLNKQGLLLPIIPSFNSDSKDITECSLTLIASTAILGTLLSAAYFQTNPTQSTTISSTTSTTSTTPHEFSSLYLPSLNVTTSSNIHTSSYTIPNKVYSNPMFNPISEVEQSLHTEIKKIEKRTKTLNHSYSKTKKQVEALSKQLADLLQGYESQGKYAGIFGKSKAMVDREYKVHKSASEANLHFLRMKHADLEHQATMTRRALAKSKAQTELAMHAGNSNSGLFTPRRNNTRTPSTTGSKSGGRFTFDEGISQMELLRDAIAMIRSTVIRLDQHSLKESNAALSTVKSSGDSASILMGRSLSVCKAALIEFCELDTFTATSSDWNVSLVNVCRVPKRRRSALANSLTLAVAAFDSIDQIDIDETESTIEDAVVDGFCLNCTLLATLCEFSKIDDAECLKRAKQREGFNKKKRNFDRRGSTVALRAAGLLNY